MSSFSPIRSSYKAIGELIWQLRFTPADTLLQQAYRAERLIRVIVAEKAYPYDFICYKLTGYNSKGFAGRLIRGGELLSDLSEFIWQVSNQILVSIKRLPEQAILVDELLKQLGMDLDEFMGWRPLGLAVRSAIVDDKILPVILQPSWEWFKSCYEGMVASRNVDLIVPRYEQDSIVYSARALAYKGLSYCKIEKILERRFKRPAEVIRAVILKVLNHERGSEENKKVFAIDRLTVDKIKRIDKIRADRAEIINTNIDTSITNTNTNIINRVSKSAEAYNNPSSGNRFKGGLSSEDIFKLYKEGLSIDDLALLLDRPRSSIYRLIKRCKIKEWVNKRPFYYYLPDFDLPGSSDNIVLPAEGIITARRENNTLNTPLSPQEEHILFKAYNYIKWRMAELIDRAKREGFSKRTLSQLDQLSDLAEKIRVVIISANWGLIVRIAKNHISYSCGIDELISEATIPLLKSIECFDFRRGNKFSTYLSWAVMRDLARYTGKVGSLIQHYKLLDKDQLDRTLAYDINDGVDPEDSYKSSILLLDALSMLSAREQLIIRNRFSIERDGLPPKSLSELGRELGISKERVRQIEAGALKRLKDYLLSSFSE